VGYRIPLAAAVLLVMGGLYQGQDAGADTPDATKDAEAAPVANWGNWWPKGQFGKNDAVTYDAIGNADATFELISFGGIRTPWGGPTALLARNADGVRLALNFFRKSADVFPDAEGEPLPKAGEIKASIYKGSDLLYHSQEENPTITSWAGGSLGMQGNLAMSFPHLPPDLNDYWIRVDMLKETHWFLIPYGLGCKVEEQPQISLIKGGAPTAPPLATEHDNVHTWRAVSYDLGRTKDKQWHVSASISNPFDTAITIRIYNEDRQFSLTHPRTSAVYNWPEGYPRFCSWTSVSRNDASDMHRSDTFQFWRTPFQTRGMGLLRVTLEDEVFEKTVPSSLFNYTHGTIPKK
jgi:hypothetical protein